MLARNLLGLACLLLPLTASADRIDEWARKQMAANHIPGMIVAVYRHGRATKVGTYGLADIEQRVPVKRNTIFEVCSITKQFTATSILLLQEDGKLSLDDKVAKFIPELPKTWTDITLRQLLQHISGLSDDVMNDEFGNGSMEKQLKMLTTLPTPTPNQAWSYCNTGYWLLGKVIEKASGTSYYTFLQKRIFDPLGMKDTHPNYQKMVIPNRARGYGWDPTTKQNVNETMLTDLLGFGDGGLISTVDDLNLWSEALKHNKVLKPDSRKLMLAPAQLEGGDIGWAEGMSSNGYGLGVFLSGTPEHRVEKHSGGWIDASAQLTRFLDDDVTVVVLTNAGGWAERPWVGEELGALYVKNFHLPDWKSTTTDSEFHATLTKFIEAGVAKKVDASVTSDALAKQMTAAPDALAAFLKPLDPKSLQLVQKIPQGKRTLYLYRTSPSSILCIERDASGKINDLTPVAIPTILP